MRTALAICVALGLVYGQKSQPKTIPEPSTQELVSSYKEYDGHMVKVSGRVMSVVFDNRTKFDWRTLFFLEASSYPVRVFVKTQKKPETEIVVGNEVVVVGKYHHDRCLITVSEAENGKVASRVSGR